MRQIEIWDSGNAAGQEKAEKRIKELERENERLRQALDNMLSWAMDGNGWRDGNDRKSVEWRKERDEAMVLLGYDRPTEGE